jgi:hypothetical protein
MSKLQEVASATAINYGELTGNRQAALDPATISGFIAIISEIIANKVNDNSQSDKRAESAKFKESNDSAKATDYSKFSNEITNEIGNLNVNSERQDNSKASSEMHSNLKVANERPSGFKSDSEKPSNNLRDALNKALGVHLESQKENVKVKNSIGDNDVKHAGKVNTDPKNKIDSSQDNQNRNNVDQKQRGYNNEEYAANKSKTNVKEVDENTLRDLIE